MSVFSDAGIYVWLDLDTFTTQIVQTAPTWTEDQFLAFATVMDVFQQYDNLAGFWVGNEVINTAAGSPAGPYVKAAAADMKSYMKAKNYRRIPLGYSAADISELRPSLQNYLACGSDPDQAIDFFGLNSYEWCGDATYETSGYSNLQAMADGYSIPIFFSETGCNVGGERTFADQAAIFGPEMIGTWSGSIIYEWVQESNDYGLVTYPNGVIYSGAPIPIQPDYNNLVNQWQTISPTGIASAAYTPSFSPPACPASTAGGWLINGNPPLPTLGSGVVNAAAASSIQLLPPSSPTSTPAAAISGAGPITASSTVKIDGIVTMTSSSNSSPLTAVPLPTTTGSASAGGAGSKSASTSSSSAAARRSTGSVFVPVIVGAAVMVMGWLV